MSNETRHTLIQRMIETPDEKSWEEFDLTYRPYVYGILSRINSGPLDNEDITQAVMLKLWKGLKTFDYRPGKCKFRSWVAIIARNTLYKEASLKRNKVTLNTDAEADVSIDSPISPEIETLVNEEWKSFILKKAMESTKGQFSERVFEVFWLSSTGKSVEEVASETNTEVNTVYVYRRRVEAVLKKEVARLFQDLD
ncbi:MAG: sigma-70 family RNA polymerase sigma factor [Lentisphaeraceae bacterium]|nr:sigma-70 family RNA polymerase sigma factor [Lentisphaeraceae bacterium]